MVTRQRNLLSTEGVEPLQRRSPGQQDTWVDVATQPKVMIVVIDESDPHANERNSTTVTFGVLYVLRTDDVQDKDGFWYAPPFGQRFRWGIVGGPRWDIDHALSGINYGVKQFRIRKGG